MPNKDEVMKHLGVNPVKTALVLRRMMNQICHTCRNLIAINQNRKIDDFCKRCQPIVQKAMEELQ